MLRVNLLSSRLNLQLIRRMIEMGLNEAAEVVNKGIE